MGWTTPVDWTTKTIPDQDDMNEQVRDNLNETAPAKVTTKGDVVAATGANAIARVAVGADDTVLGGDSGAAAGVSFKDPAASHSHTPVEVATQGTNPDTYDSNLSNINHTGFASLGGLGYDDSLDHQVTITPANADHSVVIAASCGGNVSRDSGLGSGSDTVSIQVRVVKIGTGELASASNSVTVEGDNNERYEAAGVGVIVLDEAPGASAHTYEVEPGRTANGDMDFSVEAIDIQALEVGPQ